MATDRQRAAMHAALDQMIDEHPLPWCTRADNYIGDACHKLISMGGLLDASETPAETEEDVRYDLAQSLSAECGPVSTIAQGFIDRIKRLGRGV